MRKTKIVCTLGPSTDNEEVLRQIMAEGMDVARCNFSHGTYDDHKRRMDTVKKLRKEVGRPVAILLDTKGPEVRVKSFREGKVTLEEGQLFTLTADEVEGTKDIVSVTYNRLYEDLEEGMRVLIDDGLIEMKVEKVDKTNIVCRVINGGTVSNHKGVNVPDVDLSMPYISEKDREDILFGIEQDVDFIAASFVQKKEDILQLILTISWRFPTALWWPGEIWVWRFPTRMSLSFKRKLSRRYTAQASRLLRPRRCWSP